LRAKNENGDDSIFPSKKCDLPIFENAGKGPVQKLTKSSWATPFRPDDLKREIAFGNPAGQAIGPE
jgi:hypothetical protein